MQVLPKQVDLLQELNAELDAVLSDSERSLKAVEKRVKRLQTRVEARSQELSGKMERLLAAWRGGFRAGLQ